MKNLISSEQVDIFDPNMVVVISFDVLGSNDVSLFVCAAKQAFRTFEATMSKVVLDEKGEAYYEPMSESGCSVQITDLDFDTIILENEKLPLQIESGEMMRIFLRQYDAKTQVLIMSHHLTGDGKSVVYFIEQMMLIAANEKHRDDILPLVLLNETTLPKNSHIPIFYKWLANSYNRKWKNNAVIFGMQDRT